MEKLITIITITLNNLSGLIKTVDSVHSQTFEYYEHIIVDGLSNDGTDVYLKDIAYTNVGIISERDNGLYDAMNKGIRIATGKYILFMNAGDTFADEKVLNELAQKIKKTEPDFIYGDSVEENSEGRIKYYKKARHHKYIWYGMFTHHQAMVFKKNIIMENKINFDLNYPIAADYKFTLEYLNNSLTYQKEDYPICIFMQGGISSNWYSGMIEQWKIRKSKNYGVIKCTSIFAFHLMVIFLRKNAKFIYEKMRFKSNV